MGWRVGMENDRVARGFWCCDWGVGALERWLSGVGRVFLRLRVGWIELLAGRKANAFECVRRKSP